MKRLYKFLITLILLLTCLHPAGAANQYWTNANVESHPPGTVTQEQALNWLNYLCDNHIGIDMDGTAGEYSDGILQQCVDLAKAYYKYLGFEPKLGNGGSYGDGNHLPPNSGWKYIYNPTIGDLEPGDIAFHYASNHVWIVTKIDTTRNRIYGAHQHFTHDWGNTDYVESYDFDAFADKYNLEFYIDGVIRPVFANSSSSGSTGSGNNGNNSGNNNSGNNNSGNNNSGNNSSNSGNNSSNEAVKITGITLNQTTLELNLGGSANITATVTPKNASNSDLEWKLTNTTVASLKEKDFGVTVSAIKPGVTTLICSSKSNPEVSTTCLISVLPKEGSLQGKTGYFGYVVWPSSDVDDYDLYSTLKDMYNKGQMDSNNHITYNGQVYYANDEDGKSLKFSETEPVPWKVLEDDGDSLLLITKDLYHNSSYSNALEGVNWENSDARAYLNGLYIKRSFTPEMEKDILISDVDNSESPIEVKTPWGKTTPKSDPATKDKVFLPSAAEMKQYGFDTDESRRAVPYGYSETDESKFARYYTRTVGQRGQVGGDYAYCVYVDKTGKVGYNGAILGFGSTWSAYYRPMMRIKKNSKYFTQSIHNAVNQNKIEVHRLYNTVTAEHLFTTDSNEVKVLSSQADWNYEGVGWNSPETGDPVFRLYSPFTGQHLYTKDKNEVNVLTSQGWSQDNSGQPLFYSGGTQKIYRVYHEGILQHHLTTSEGEYNHLGANGWNQEGIALYGLE